MPKRIAVYSDSYFDGVAITLDSDTGQIDLVGSVTVEDIDVENSAYGIFKTRVNTTLGTLCRELGITPEMVAAALKEVG